MSGTIIVAALTQLVPLVEMLFEQAKTGQTPTPQQEADVQAALKAAHDAIQAS